MDSSKAINYLSVCLCAHAAAGSQPQARLAEHGDESMINRGVANCKAVSTTSISVNVLYIEFFFSKPNISGVSEPIFFETLPHDVG